MNEATLPVKRITDFPLKGSTRLIRRPVFWVVFVLAMTVIGAMLVTYTAVNEVEATAWVVIGFLANVFLGCKRVIELLGESRKARAEKYAAYLASVSQELLKAIPASPEYDQASKVAVINYLSATRPGWSLS